MYIKPQHCYFSITKHISQEKIIEVSNSNYSIAKKLIFLEALSQTINAVQTKINY